MFPYLLFVLLWALDNMMLPSSSILNVTQNQAEVAFRAGNYETAVELYRQIVEGSIYADPAARLNMATAQLAEGNIEEASKNYHLLTRVANKRLAAAAHSQIAHLAILKKDTTEALNQLMVAILLDRKNKFYVQNYEVLRFNFSGKVPPVPTPSVKEQEAKVEKEEKEGSTPEAGDQREQILQNLDRLNMTEDQAQSILDAMKINERQYIYQLRRHSSSSKEEPKKIEW